MKHRAHEQPRKLPIFFAPNLSLMIGLTMEPFSILSKNRMLAISRFFAFKVENT